MTVRRKNFLDAIIILMMLSYVLIQTWAHFARYLSEQLVMILIVVRLLQGIKRKVRKKEFLLLIIGMWLLAIGAVNIALSDREYLYENIRFLLLPGLTVLYFIYLCRNEMEFLKTFFQQLILLLNAYLLINSLIMLIQTSGNYFLVDTQTSNTFYPDLITGLMGADGTHRVTLFTVCVTLINYVLEGRCEKSGRRIWSMYWIAILISVYVSTQNDNNTFFIFVPLFWMATYVVSHKFDFGFIWNFKYQLTFLVIVVVTFVMLSVKVNAFATFISRIQSVLQSIFEAENMKEYQLDERVLLFQYAVENGGIWGRGIGSIKMFADNSIATFFGTHFGMASAQSLIYLFGVVPYLMILLSVSYGFDVNGKLKNFMVCFFLLFGVTFYTQIFTSYGLTVLMCIAISVMEITGSEYDEAINYIRK